MQQKKYGLAIICFLTLVTSSFMAIGQTDEDIDGDVTQQLWVEMHPHILLSQKLHFYGDFGFRTIVDEHSWARVFIRPSIKYQISDLFSIQGSVNVSFDWSKNDVNLLLITPRQGVKLDWPNFARLNFYHLVRLEERFSYNTSDWSKTIDLRGRYLLHGNFDFRLNESGSYWFIPFYGELFLRFESDEEKFIRNQARTGFGLGYDPSNDWQYIFMLNWQGSTTSDENSQIQDMIFQLKIKKTLRKWSKYPN